MENIILISICLVALVANFVVSLKYNLHMLQLNGYKNNEHKIWLKKNSERQRFRGVYLVCALILFVAVPLILLGIVPESLKYVAVLIVAMCLFLPFWGYYFRNKINTKKKLVYTKRVKRILGVTIGLYVLVIFLLVMLLWLSGLIISAIYDSSWAGFGVFLFTVTIIVTMLVLAPFVMLFYMPSLVMLSNHILKPVEKRITEGFINDAKRILNEHSGMTIIGITGSYGKTSLKFYLKALLSEKYNVCATPESYNTHMGVVRTIRENMRPTDEIFLCEMGARHVGDIKEICDIVHPHHGIITSIGPQHLETFRNIENVRSTKYELADALPADGKLILNGDSEQIRADKRSFNRIYYGIDSKDGYYAEDIKLTPLGTDFTVVTPKGEKEVFHTRLIGDINVLNVLGAIAVANEFGISLQDLKIPVRRLEPVAHRLELIERGDVTIIDDAFNSNPVGSKAAVETLKMFEGVRVLITPGMVELGDKDDELHYAFGTYAADCCDYILLVNPYRTKSILKGALDSGFPAEKIREFSKFPEALDFAYKIQEEGHKYILLENDLPDNY